MRSHLLVVAFFVAAVAACLTLVRPAPADDPTTTHLGKKIVNIPLTDAAGKTTHLYDLKDKKAIVLVFLSFECPVSASYSQPLADMANELTKLDVAFVGISTNQDETPAEVAKHTKEFNLPFTVYLDKKLAAADALAAGFTPEAFLLDGDFVLRYRGRIDDSFYARLKKNQEVTHYDLRQALDEMVSDRPITTQATVPIGCPIVRPTAKSAPARANLTYYKDVLPILQKNCQECHRPGEVGPFSLMTYRQAVNWATDIKDYTQARTMPPWKISEGLPFHNERKLNANDLATLAAWADNATPEGNPQDAPPPMKYAEGWKLGPPDLVLTLSDDYQVGPTGNDVFRCFVMPTNLAQDQYVESIEVRPSNSRVVHHALLFIDTAGQGRKLEKQQPVKPANDPHGGTDLDKGPGYYGGMGVGFTPTGTLGGWAPGQLPRTLPDGIGIKLPKGSDVVMQVHYHRNGRLEKDKTSVGLYFSKKKVERPYQAGLMAGIFLVIPAGNEHFVVKGTSYVTEDMMLYDIMPHMHMLGKEIKVTMTPPDGKPTLLFNIKDWDYNWQESYFLKEPLALKPGTRLDLEAVYNNSASNPNNPFNPPRMVTLGEQTFNEMCFVFLGGTSNPKFKSLPLTRTLTKKLKDKDAGKSYQVPFRFSDSGHILVRAKINGHGPYNFIVDTGAPLLYLSESVAKSIGIKASKQHIASLEKLQIEGGPVHNQFPCRVETPFQLEGMNALGFAGVELHGVLGYTLLANYKMEFDPTKDHMTWTRLDFTPPAPQPVGIKDNTPGSLDSLGKVMKMFAALMGIKGPQEPSLRGFLGVQLSEKDNAVYVDTVLEKGPAATAGVLAGDRVVAVLDKDVASSAQAIELLAKVTPGQHVKWFVQRGDSKKEITITAGEGI